MHPVVGMFLCHLLPFVRIFFRCFGMSRFVCFVFTYAIFYTGSKWWVFTGISVIASLLRSPGLFSVVWSISQSYGLDSFDASSDLQLTIFQVFWCCSMGTNCNWCHRYFHLFPSKMLWNIKLSVIPAIVGTLGTIPKNLQRTKKEAEDIGNPKKDWIYLEQNFVDIG